MTTKRTTASIVGVLFLVQTVAFIIAEQLFTGVLKGANYLAGASGDVNALAAGALLASNPTGRACRHPRRQMTSTRRTI